MIGDEKPFVSIIMPALNEEKYIAAAIASIIPDTRWLEYELLVADGGSTDRTCEIVEQMASSNPRIRVITNEKRLQAAGVNKAARAADPRARCFVRADCHLLYPDEFIERCMHRLWATDCASVVVPLRTHGRSCMQKAIAAAQNCLLGNGGAPHRSAARSGFVNHGHHAAFDREIFLELGGYDEGFSHNEDAEFDKRLIKSGKKIYLDAEAAVTYYPRTTLTALARQYFNYGSGRACTLLKHFEYPKPRQLLPVAALLGCFLSLLLATIHPAFLAVCAAYVSACLAWGIGIAICRQEVCLALSGIAAVVMHMSWASGFLFRILRRRP